MTEKNLEKSSSLNLVIDNYLQNLNNLLGKHVPSKNWISKRESFKKKLGSQKDYKPQEKNPQYLENLKMPK